jgi:hypothetical protein
MEIKYTFQIVLGGDYHGVFGAAQPLAQAGID